MCRIPTGTVKEASPQPGKAIFGRDLHVMTSASYGQSRLTCRCRIDYEPEFVALTNSSGDLDSATSCDLARIGSELCDAINDLLEFFNGTLLLGLLQFRFELFQGDRTFRRGRPAICGLFPALVLITIFGHYALNFSKQFVGPNRLGNVSVHACG
jgi:hypothetical protein